MLQLVSTPLEPVQGPAAAAHAMGFSISDIYTISLPTGQTLSKQPRDNGIVLQKIQS